MIGLTNSRWTSSLSMNMAMTPLFSAAWLDPKMYTRTDSSQQLSTMYPSEHYALEEKARSQNISKWLRVRLRFLTDLITVIGNEVSIVGSLRDREVACSASDHQGSNFESCVWRTVSFQSSHHPQEVLLAQFSLSVHKGGLKPDSFHLFLGNEMSRFVNICAQIK